MRGRCLCGGIDFEVTGRVPKIDQCHRSLCRRVSGSSANAALIVGREQFAWLTGEQLIERYATADGWQSPFCRRCGSPLPNPSRGGRAWWVPVSLLEDGPELELGAHLCAAAKAGWDRFADAGTHLDEMAARGELDRLLRREQATG